MTLPTHSRQAGPADAWTLDVDRVVKVGVAKDAPAPPTVAPVPAAAMIGKPWDLHAASRLEAGGHLDGSVSAHILVSGAWNSAGISISRPYWSMSTRTA